MFDICALEYLSQHKHLEVSLSSNLSWPNHMYTAVKKLIKLSLSKKNKIFRAHRYFSTNVYIFVRPLLVITRRDLFKLSMMIKIHNNLVVSLLEDITPGIQNVISHYNTRTFSNYYLSRCRLKVFN